MSKYISLEYLTQNNPNPKGVQFKGIFGDRSIGKTHGLLKHLFKNRVEGQAFLILRRNSLELNFKPFVQKYGEAFDIDLEIKGNTICDFDNGKILAYFSALSLSERSKHNNYDFPYITDIIVDEVYAEKPNRNEFSQLQTWITTVSRRTNYPFHPVTVWLLGNYNYGYSPIMDALGVSAVNGSKQKTNDGVYLFSEMESPANVINVSNPLVRKMEINEGNVPVIDWVINKQGYALYDFGVHCYIATVDKATQAYNMSVKRVLLRNVMAKKGIPPLYVENYECLRFVDLPKGVLE